MITICYNCHREVDGSGIPFGKPVSAMDVSHGICVQCEEVERERLEEEAEDLLRKRGRGAKAR
ncbi:MAG: hypothetical protein ACXABY_30710 [Candidatus Thorarchaeota archaeon]|jgi:hypothetical protein